MSDDVKTPIPSLKRNSRDTETREATAQRKPWAPPSRLDAPPAPDGYRHRWIRTQAAGIEDKMNVTAKLREGYELVRADEYPDFHSSHIEDGQYAGVISSGGMVLARIPEETAEERRAYYESRTQDQISAADNDLLKTNARTSMKINRPERSSRTSIGGPRGDTD